eukprot:1977766-Pleurochrysis_carterae.AAC.1
MGTMIGYFIHDPSTFSTKEVRASRYSEFKRVYARRKHRVRCAYATLGVSDAFAHGNPMGTVIKYFIHDTGTFCTNAASARYSEFKRVYARRKHR